MMEAPLRAFLMMRSSEGTWTVTVCRDLSAVMRTWSARTDPDNDVAVLHVGFDRPPSHSFNQVTESHQGCILFTAAAKHALPKSLVASTRPVGVAEGIEVFVGLKGWGYTLQDPTVSNNPAGSSRSRIVTPEPQGWISSFLKEHSSDGEVLSEQGIFDDASYLDREENLKRSVRHRTGLFRVHHILGANCTDPCKLACAAPPWLAEQKLTSLKLPLRAYNAFEAKDIKTVRDLGNWSSESLLSFQNFGRKSLTDTLQALIAALNDGPPGGVTTGTMPETSHLMTEVRRSLLSFSDRERDILVRRLGFETQPETLQELADDYGITRERVRQIEARATKKWLQESSWDDLLEQKISRLMIGRSFPLPVAGVEAIDAWFDGVSLQRVFFRNLVQTVCGDRIHVVQIDGLYYFSLMSEETWQRTISEASSLLASGTGLEWSEEYARSLVRGLLPDTAKEFGSLLWDKACRYCHFSNAPDGSRILTSYGRGAEQLVEAILVESDTPLHYTAIAERAKQKTGKNLDVRRAHNAAASVGFLFARGTYGLARHVPLSDEKMSELRAEAENIVCSEGPSKQWHASEILSEILERIDASYDGLDKYLLEIALSASSILKPLGKMTWICAAADIDDQSRIDIHQAVVAIVQAAGRPLSTSDIKERLTAVRGVNDFFQIFSVDPLVRVRPGVWGINDRDVPFSREEQRDSIEELVCMLDEKKSGIHASELADLLNLQESWLDAFLSIVSQDERLKMARGRYVYLAEWGSPRRETISHAVLSVLEGANGPLTLDDVVGQVASRIGRKVDKPAISGALRALETELMSQLKSGA